jgi:uncharacterized membrane protein YfcA
MNTQESKSIHPVSPGEPVQKPQSINSGQVLGGLVVIIVGGVLLANQLGVEFPEWFFTWQMLIIAIGVFSGAKNSFRDWSWLIPVSVGVVLLAHDFVDGFSLHEAWPVIIIVIGLSMIFNSTRKGKRNCF